MSSPRKPPHRTTCVMPRRASNSSCQWMNGRPTKGNSALGTRSVTGRSRIASPPARMATGSMSGQHQLGALEIEPEADLLQPGLCHRGAQLVAVTRIEHQESTAAGAHELAADRAIAPGQLVP